mgnify:FL=1
MRVLFLEIDTEKSWAVASLGPAFLAAVIRREGHEAAMLRVVPDTDLAALRAEVAARAPDLVGLSLTTRQWLRGREVAAAIAPLGIPLIAGGLHPTFAPEAVLAAPGFDAVCLGEGELPFASLVRHLEAGLDIRDAEIANIWVKGGTRPAMSPPIPEIDSIPFMARDMLDEHHGVVNVTTQRGCPFPCTYCAAGMFNRLYKGLGEYGRRRSKENVFAELEAIRAAGQLTYVIFLDDTFTINHPWVLDFCSDYAERIGVPFTLHARADTVPPRLIDALAAAGCRHIVYGVESGSERFRREIMKRAMSNARIVDTFRRTREAGIIATANYMIGLPGETREDIEATFELHARAQPVDFGVFVFYPFPGTQLFEVCRQRGYLPHDWLERPARHDASILDLPDLTKEEIAETFARWEAVQARDRADRMAEAERLAAAQMAAARAAC